jgi:hypothetical protein
VSSYDCLVELVQLVEIAHKDSSRSSSAIPDAQPLYLTARLKKLKKNGDRVSYFDVIVTALPGTRAG